MITTPAIRSARRREQLAVSGLHLLGEHAPSREGGLPSERSVWTRVVDLSTTPLLVVSDDRREAAHREWSALSAALRIFGASGSFLISVPTPGPDLGWADVRTTETTRLPNEVIEEFVALSDDGLRYSAVTAEENGWWIIGGETGETRSPGGPGRPGGPDRLG